MHTWDILDGYYSYIMYILCIYCVYVMYMLCIYYVYIMYILCISFISCILCILATIKKLSYAITKKDEVNSVTRNLSHMIWFWIFNGIALKFLFYVLFCFVLFCFVLLYFLLHSFMRIMYNDYFWKYRL